MREIATLADEHDVDLVIVAGDLFDSSTPSPEAEQIVYQALLDLAREGRTVAVIAGNHDNARRLRAVAPLLELGRIRLVAEPARPSDGGVIDLTARDGSDVKLAMLPFVSKRGIVRAEQLMENAAFENAQLYSDRLRLLLEHLCAGFDGSCVNVLAGHAFVMGGQAGGGERAAHLVEEYAVTAESFPPTISYGALGHLHRPQRVGAGAPVYYSGSPLQLDFGESSDRKSVNVVSAVPGLPAEVTQVPLTSGRTLRTIKAPLDELLAMEPIDDAWLRVVVEGQARAGLADMIRGSLGDTVVDVRIETERQAASTGGADRTGRSPQELFAEYLTISDIEDPRVSGLFAELLDRELDGAEP